MRTLHFIRKSRDPLAEEAVAYEGRRETVAVLLIQDGVWNAAEFPGEVFAAREDLEARALESPRRKVDFQEIARLLLEYDRVVVW